MINEWVAFLDTLDNPQGAHEGLAHTLELIEMRWYHMIKICPFFHIVQRWPGWVWPAVHHRLITLLLTALGSQT